MVVRHQNGGRASAMENLLDFFAHLAPHVGIQVAERLIQKNHDGLGSKGAGERDALLLPARKLVGVA